MLVLMIVVRIIVLMKFLKVIKLIKLCYQIRNLLNIFVEKILNPQYLSSIMGGHQGVSRTYNRMKNYFKFSNIKVYIKTCKKCQINKSSRFTKMPMVITSTCSSPFEKIYIDIVGPINPPSN